MAVYCGIWSVVAHLEDGQRIALPLSCKSWACPHCRRRNRRLLTQRLRGADAHSTLTLTCSTRRYTSYDQAFLAMSAAIPHLFKRLRRLNPKAGIEYFLVWERTVKGWPHCHLVLRAPYLPQPIISRIWEELTGAPVVDIRALYGPDGVTNYLAKYLGKEPCTPPGFRRYRCSRHFLGPLLALPPSYDAKVTRWTLEPLPPHVLGSQWSVEGMTCRLTPHGTVRAFPRGHPAEPLHDSFTLWLGIPVDHQRLSLWSPSTSPTPAQVA